MHPFRAAVERRDYGAFPALLTPDVQFVSPVAFASYAGRDLVAAILRAAGETFDGFAYERQIVNPDGRDLALLFRAQVSGLEVHGCDFLHLDEDGLIDHFIVMVRPLSAASELARQMAVRFGAIQEEMGLGG